MEKITLKNGLRVANLSSPHPFNFDDGTVLPAVDAETCKRLSATPVEKVIDRGGWKDIELSFQMNSTLEDTLWRVGNDPSIDIILVSMSTMTAIKASGIGIGKFRVVRLADRATKTVRSDEFCI